MDEPRAGGFGDRFRTLDGSELRECRASDGSLFYGVRPTAAGATARRALRTGQQPDINIRQLNTNAVLRLIRNPRGRAQVLLRDM